MSYDERESRRETAEYNRPILGLSKQSLTSQHFSNMVGKGGHPAMYAAFAKMHACAGTSPALRASRTLTSPGVPRERGMQLALPCPFVHLLWLLSS